MLLLCPTEEDYFTLSECQCKIVRLQISSPRQDADEAMFVCDEEGLQEKLEDIAWPKGLPWVVEQTLLTSEPSNVEDSNNDLERELAFHNMVRIDSC